MIMMGERLDILAFRPLFIYNSYKNACQEQAVDCVNLLAEIEG